MASEGNSDERHLVLLREATLRGTDAVLRAAAAVLGQLSGSDYAVIVENVGDSWQNALKDDLPLDAVGVIEKLPGESREWDTRREIPDLGMTFVPLRAGALAAIVPKLLDPRSEIATTTSIAAEMCDILVRDAERIENLRFLIDEVSRRTDRPPRDSLDAGDRPAAALQRQRRSPDRRGGHGRRLPARGGRAGDAELRRAQDRTDGPPENAQGAGAGRSGPRHRAAVRDR